MSAHKNKTELSPISLSNASILIIGSSVLKESLFRDLSRSITGKILLLDTDNANSNKTWTPADVEESVSQANIVIDALNDWQKKLALSDICMERQTVLVHCGLTGFRFQIYTMIPGRSACLRCALPLAGIDEVPLKPAAEESIEAVIELAAAWQSLEAIKYLTKMGVLQGNELFKFDCLSGELEVIRGLDADPECPDCGRNFVRRSHN